MKVLILSCTTGGGHNAAAKAISKELSSRSIDNNIVDALSFAPSLKKELIEKGTDFFSRYLPELYGIGLDAVSKANETHKALYMSFALYGGKLAAYIDENGYDTVVCVHVFPAFMLSAAKKEGKIKAKTYFVATDYSFAPGLEYTDMDGYFVPKGFTGLFAQNNIPNERLYETGIPVDPAVYDPEEKNIARRELGLRDDVPLILISGGAVGCGPIKELAYKVKTIFGKDAIIVVMCGYNKQLLTELSLEVKDGFFLPIGFTNKPITWMAAADVMITKAGGLSTTEAASIGIPMVFIKALPGLEMINMDYYIDNGCGISGDTLDELCNKAVEILEDDELRKSLLESQRKLYSHNAVGRVVDVLYINRKQDN